MLILVAGEPSLKENAALRRVTVLGLGHIGNHIGRLAKCFGVRITGIRRTLGVKPEYFTEEDRLLPVARLDEVLPESDHLVLSLPASPDTTVILNARSLALLPQNAGIYNVGRRNAVDEQAFASCCWNAPSAKRTSMFFAQSLSRPISLCEICPTA